MTEIDKTIQQQTANVIKTVAANSPSFPGELKGTNYTITYDSVSLADIFKMIDGGTVTKNITVKGTVQGQPVEQSFSNAFSICDFNVEPRFEQVITYPKNDGTTATGKILMVIENIKIDASDGVTTYCELSEAEKKNAADTPFLSMEHENAPTVIKLSEEKDLNGYLDSKDKIASATINKLDLKIEEAPDLGTIEIETQLFAKSLDDTTDSYAKIENSDGDMVPNPDYWVGNFLNELLVPGSSFNLEYTYDGRYIIQKAIKNIDFELGIKTYYKINPGSTVPTGVFRLSLTGEFFFSLMPLR